MPTATEPSRWYFASTVENEAATDKTILQFETAMANKLVLLESVAVQQTGGTAASFQPRVFDVAAGANASINERYKATSVLAAELSHENEILVEVLLDTDARAYLQPSPSSGADNDYDYAVSFSPCRRLGA